MMNWSDSPLIQVYVAIVSTARTYRVHRNQLQKKIHGSTNLNQDFTKLRRHPWSLLHRLHQLSYQRRSQ